MKFYRFLSLLLCLISCQAVLAGSLNILPIQFYEMGTNQTFSIQLEGKKYFLRIGRPNPREVGIDREEEIKHYRFAERLGIVPRLHAYDTDRGMLISEFVEGHNPNAEELRDPSLVGKVVSGLKLLHRTEYPGGDPLKTAMGQIDELYESLLESDPSIRSDEDLRRWRAHVEFNYRGYYDGMRPALLHGDLFRGNLLVEDSTAKIYFVDWEYSYIGYPIDDLGKFCSSNWLNDEEIQFVSNSYFENQASPLLLTKLKQNIFLQQVKLYMWLKIQARSAAPDSFVHQLQIKVKDHLNGLLVQNHRD